MFFLRFCFALRGSMKKLLTRMNVSCKAYTICHSLCYSWSQALNMICVCERERLVWLVSDHNWTLSMCDHFLLSFIPVMFQTRCGSVAAALRSCLVLASPTSSVLINLTPRIWRLTCDETPSEWRRFGWMSSKATCTWRGTSPWRWVVCVSDTCSAQPSRCVLISEYGLARCWCDMLSQYLILSVKYSGGVIIQVSMHLSHHPQTRRVINLVMCHMWRCLWLFWISNKKRWHKISDWLKKAGHTIPLKVYPLLLWTGSSRCRRNNNICVCA